MSFPSVQSTGGSRETVACHQWQVERCPDARFGSDHRRDARSENSAISSISTPSPAASCRMVTPQAAAQHAGKEQEGSLLLRQADAHHLEHDRRPVVRGVVGDLQAHLLDGSAGTRERERDQVVEFGGVAATPEGRPVPAFSCGGYSLPRMMTATVLSRKSGSSS